MVAPENPIDMEEIAEIVYPWEDKSNICCNIAHFDDTFGGFTMIGHWKLSVIKPLVIGIVSILTLVDLIFDLCISVTNMTVLFTLCNIAVVVYFCLFTSYWILIIRGPGYVPYNWSVSRKKEYSWSEQMDKLTMYCDQENFARYYDRPGRASFSRSAKRFVLRADHFCLWTDSWIGFNNQRYFILFTFWTVMYVLCWLLFKIEWYMQLFSPFKWYYLITIALTFGMLYILGFSFHHFRHGFCNACHNVTVIEKHNNRQIGVYDRGCFENFSEICGKKKYVLCWPIPCCCLKPTVDGFYSE